MNAIGRGQFEIAVENWCVPEIVRKGGVTGAPRAESGPIFNFQSLIENYERCCGWGFLAVGKAAMEKHPRSGL